MMRVNDFTKIRLTRFCQVSLLLMSALLLLTHIGCGPGSQEPPQPADGRIVEGGKDWNDNREVVSPIILREPLYECTNVVWVSGFIQGADVTIFEGANPIGTAFGHFPSGEQFKVTINFVRGQVITAKQTFAGVTGGPSNAVTVRGVRDDYPSGVPTPNIYPPPLFKCGLATSATDFVPGAELSVQSEPSTGGGGFGPGVVIGGGAAAAPWPGWWTGVAPPFELDARVTVSYRICDLTSPRSPALIVQNQPATIPKPVVQDNVYEGGRIVAVENGLNGSRLRVSSGATQIGDSATPGGAPQLMWIDPAATSGASLTATQSLCDTSLPSDPVTVRPCSDLPAAVGKQPQPGDDQIELITYVHGARIIVLAGGVEIGDGGAPVIKLTRPLNNGEELMIIQILGECRSRFVHIIRVRCPLGDDPKACAADWPMFRHNTARTAEQQKPSALSNPDLVRVLKIKPSPWPFTPAGGGAFRASPIVYNGVVYIGNSNGRFYAVDAVSGSQLWQYPLTGQPALTSQFTSNPSSFGIASSATIARISKTDRGEVDAVIFGAPDQSIGARLGSGRLFALNAHTGEEIWKSPEIAVLDGLTRADTSQRHEQIGYSSPLVLNNRVYVGIADHGDNPIQNGRVVAVDLNTGAIDGTFNYRSTNTRGGGVWSSTAGGPDGELYVTTGNAKCWNSDCQSEPSVNNSLSLLRLNPSSGAVIWKIQPVPFALDADPDWASGATFVPATCGKLVASTMKDGWSYAVAADGGALSLQYPATGFPFTPGDGTFHGDSRYLVPGAAWGDVFITMMGGQNVSTVTRIEDSALYEGFSRLHGLNLCAGRNNPVRWLLDVPGVVGGGVYQLGPPTVSRGIVFVGTNQGRLIAFADPAVRPATSYLCTWLGVTTATCEPNGFRLVPQPSILANIDLGGGGIFRTEPVLSHGRVYVATEGGRLFMLEP